MRISELSRRSGVPMPTIKFYLREGILPPGELRGVNQASYDERHLRRLKLIRTLRDVGGMSLSAIRQVSRLLDQPQTMTLRVLGEAVDAMGERPPEALHTEASETWQQAAAEIDEMLRHVGWPTRSDSTARKQLIDALVSLRDRFDPNLPVQAFLPYAQAAGAIAEKEVNHLARSLRGDPAEALEAVVLGTVLWEPVLLALRRIAHEHVSRIMLDSK